MRTLPHHVRNLDCTATVTERVRACCPNTGRPHPHYERNAAGEMVDVGRFWSQLSCGHSLTDTPVGTVVVCESCQRDREGLAKLRDALAAGLVSHTRCHSTCPDSISVYRYDRKSPSGFMSLGFSVDDTPEAIALIRSFSGGLTPLSPTEAR